MTWDIVHGKGYLLCFAVPFGRVRPGKTPEEFARAAKYAHAGHYLGITDDLPGRMADHEEGRGSKVTGYVRKAGIGWTLVRVWDDVNRDEERRLKEHAARRWCPRHGVEEVMARDPGYAAVMDQARARFRDTLDQARAQGGLYAASDNPALAKRWYQVTRAANAELQEARQEAARAWVAANPRSGLTRAALVTATDAAPMLTVVANGTHARRQAAAAAELTRVPVPGGEGGDPGDPWAPGAPGPGAPAAKNDPDFEAA